MIVPQPSPDTYKVKSVFDNDATPVIAKRIAYSFGASRQAYDKVYLPQQKVPLDTTLPGPGAYDMTKPIGADAQKYSIQGRVPAPNGKFSNYFYDKRKLTLLL